MKSWRTVAERIDWRLADYCCALALGLDLLLESLFAAAVPADHRLVSALFAFPYAAPLAVRRRWPAGALIAACVLAPVQQVLHGQLFTSLPSESAMFVPILCSYGVGAWLELRRGIVTVAISCVCLYGVVVAQAIQAVPGATSLGAGLGILVFFILAPWAVGLLVRESNRRAAAFAELASRSATDQAERERAAVAEERVVIGGELQDIIAHSVSTMVVQAAGARLQLGVEPERARESMLTIEQTGREALAEMRRLLGILRHSDDPRALTPQPGLDQLPELIQATGQRGLDCVLEDGSIGELTPGVDLLAYRLIEAALGDAATHGAQRASVVTKRSGLSLELKISADAGATGVAERLSSIRERVELYDGRLELDDRRGFEVRCRLPIGATGR